MPQIAITPGIYHDGLRLARKILDGSCINIEPAKRRAAAVEYCVLVRCRESEIPATFAVEMLFCRYVSVEKYHGAQRLRDAHPIEIVQYENEPHKGQQPHIELTL